jgi:hypothetical protein
VANSSFFDDIILEGKPHFWLKQLTQYSDRSECEIRMFPAENNNAKWYKVRYPREFGSRLPRTMAGLLIPAVFIQFMSGIENGVDLASRKIAQQDAVAPRSLVLQPRSLGSAFFKPRLGRFGSITSISESSKYVELSFSFDYGGSLTISGGDPPRTRTLFAMLSRTSVCWWHAQWLTLL